MFKCQAEAQILIKELQIIFQASDMSATHRLHKSPYQNMNFYTLILHSNSFMSPLLSFINVFTIKFEQIRMIQITQNLELLDQKP